MIQMIELGKCCKIINGSTPSRFENKYWNGDIDWFTPKDLSKIKGKYLHDAPEKITELGFKSCSTTMLPPNSLLFTSRAPIGHIAINTKPACTNQGFKSLIPKNNVDVNYLYFAIKNFTPQLQDLGNGATFKELSKSSVSSFKIPLPPLPQQQKIANILDAADALIQNDKALIAKYDELTQALFLDMFGDPVSNPKGWEKIELKKLIITINKINRDYNASLIKYVDISSIDNLNFRITSTTDYSFNDRPSRAQQILKENDILLSTVRPNLKNIAINKHDGYIASTGFYVCRVNNKLNNRYLFEVLKSDSITNYFVGITAGANYPAIKSSDVSKLLVALPPIELQNQFAERVALIEEQKATAQKSLEKSEELFNSLLQKAFK